jgi:hypothetical protein
MQQKNQKRKEHSMSSLTQFEKVEREVKRMAERLTLTQLLVSSMELIKDLPEDERDAAWQSVFLLIEGARLNGVLVAEG